MKKTNPRLEQVSLEEVKISRDTVYGTIMSYKKGASVSKKFLDFFDMDYLNRVPKENREFMADFLLDWYNTAIMGNEARRDVTYRYKKLQYPEDDAIIGVDEVNEFSDNWKKVSTWNRKYNNAYTIRDYMPSKLFDEERIIRVIDEEKKRDKERKLTLSLIKGGKYA